MAGTESKSPASGFASGVAPGQQGMNESVPARGELAWTDGEFIPRQSLWLPVGDAGFVLGATVTEQLRTFHGRLFLPDDHQHRLRDSLAAVGIDPGRPLGDVFAAADRVATHNCSFGSQPKGGDLGVVIFVTPGDQPAQHGGRSGHPRTVIHSFPLAFPLWAAAYERGVSLRSVSVRQVPDACWPVHAKVRSRLHYFLADREAHAAEAGARAVVCHLDGRVSETSTANIAIVRDGRILAPPSTDALRGVSLRFVRGLAESLGIAWEDRSLTTADLATATEILLTSTPSCLLPATRFDGHPVGDGRPGPLQRRLLSAWSEQVGLDIAAQARSCGDGPGSSGAAASSIEARS
jgi:branched-subunit amino acid aminotransferase/4-amino-4-deoxychorismate lyase